MPRWGGWLASGSESKSSIWASRVGLLTHDYARSLAFLENGQPIAYISNQSLVITNAEIRYKLSLGAEGRGWFDFIPRVSGNLSVVWRNTSS